MARILRNSKMALFLHRAVGELILNIICDGGSVSPAKLGSELKGILGYSPKTFLNLAAVHDEHDGIIRNTLPRLLLRYLESIPYLSVFDNVVKLNGEDVFMAWEYSKRLGIVDCRSALLIEACKVFFENVRGQKDPNRKGRSGNTVLHLVAALPSNSDFYDRKNKEYLTVLLKNGADPRVKNDDDLTPLHIVAGRFKLGSPRGSSRVSNQARENPVVWSCNSRCKQLEVLTSKDIFLKAEFESCINVRGRDGNNILHEWVLASLTTQDTHKEIALGEFILSLGVLPNVRNDAGSTPLHCAYDVELFKFLISNGSIHERYNDDGDTPLLSVVKHGIVGGKNCTKLLQQPVRSDGDGPSPIEKIISIVSAQNQNLLARDRNGNHVIDILLQSVHLIYQPAKLACVCKTLRSLIECCSAQALNEENKFHVTPVEAVFGSIVDMYTSYDVLDSDVLDSDVLDSDVIDVYPLLDVMNALLEKGANPNVVRGRNESTLLHKCCCYAFLPSEIATQLIRILREHGADPDQRNRRGKTPQEVLNQQTILDLDLLDTLCDTQPKTTVKVDFKTKVHMKVLQKLCVSSPRKVHCYRYDPAVSIGEGAMGKVFPAIDENGRREVALKRVQKDYQEKGVVREIRALCKLAKYKQVVDYYSIVDSEPDFHFIVLELMEGDLADLILQEKRALADSSTMAKLVSDMVKGLSYLHNQTPQPILHCDLKSGNVLYTNVPNLRLKLADFGLAKDLTGYSSLAMTTGHSLVGTRGWMAPELVSREQALHTMESDVFSLGLVCHFLMSNGKHPFHPSGTVLTRQAASAQGVLPHELEQSILIGTPHMNEGALGPAGYNLLKQVLTKEIKDRPKVALIGGHCFFWSNQKKIQFLMAVGDQKELAQSRKHQGDSFIFRLETTPLAHRLINSPWSMQIPDLHYEMVSAWKHKKYATTSLVDLVRFFRNAYSHEEERSSARKAGLMSNIFFEKFPDLLLTVWTTVLQTGWDQPNPNRDRQRIKRALEMT